MIEQLISLTNSEEYIKNLGLIVHEVKLNPRMRELKMLLQIFDNLTEFDEANCQLWELSCNNYWTAIGIDQQPIPYNSLKLYHDHPILWNYGAQQFFSIEGNCNNIPQLIGELFIAHLEACGGWVDFNHVLGSLPKTLQTKRKNSMAAPLQLFHIYKDILNKYNIQVYLRSLEMPNEIYSLLLFSNTSLCPDDFNLYQPYIVGTDFMARQLK